MASSKQLIINCGASAVTAAVVSGSGQSLQIEKLVTEALNYDFSNDEAWMDAVGVALRELSHRHKFSGKATLIIPGNQVLTKTIRIPQVESSKRAQIIAFEAQQNIPYPLHEVVWDTQVIGDDGVETEVLFIACKSNTIDDFCRNVSAAGLTAEKISAATVLDYNTLQYSYEDPDDSLVINIGARSTNLLFCNADGFFVRNIALGGNSLTQNIADSLGKPFTQAEAIKHKFFGGEADYSDDEAGAKALTSAADSFMQRMSQEITRSIVNYRRQRKGAAPKRILLNGRGALLKGLTEQLERTQKVDVVFFDALQNVTLDGSIEADMEVLRLQAGEIVGEACVGLVPNGAGVNLLPESIQSAMGFASKKPFLLIAAACLALAPWPALFVFQQNAAAYAQRERALREAVQPLQARQAQIRENAARAEALGESIQRVEGLVNSKANWIRFFASLQESLSLAEDVWLDELQVLREAGGDGEPSYEVALQGQMLVRETANEDNTVDQATLSRRIKSLQTSFEDSTFVVDSRPPSIDWRSLRDGLNVLPFSINLVVDTSKPL